MPPTVESPLPFPPPFSPVGLPFFPLFLPSFSPFYFLGHPGFLCSTFIISLLLSQSFHVIVFFTLMGIENFADQISFIFGAVIDLYPRLFLFLT